MKKGFRGREMMRLRRRGRGRFWSGMLLIWREPEDRKKSQRGRKEDIPL